MKYLKISIRCLLGLLLFVMAWYGGFRIYSTHHPLSLYTLQNPPSDNPDQKTPGLKVASYNIAHGRGGEFGATNWQYKSEVELLAHLDNIAAQIWKASPDLIVLNEADFATAWSFHVNQAEYIARKCGYAYVLEQKNMDLFFPFCRFCFGNAILSRYPLQNGQFLDFPAYSDAEDFFAGNHDGVFCEVQAPSGLLGVFAVHLEYRNEGIRVACAEYMAEYCAGIRYPVIALGDFNSTPPGFPGTKTSERGENAMSYLLEKAGFRSYLPEGIRPDDYTFPSEKPFVLIDWIIGKKIKRFAGSGNINSGLSDHLMIMSEVYSNSI